VESLDQPKPPQPPLGIYTSRCDDKGRLRLPKEFEDFMRSLPDPEFFVTSLDGSIGRIYPIQTWRSNQEKLENDQEDQKLADAAQYLADHFGSVAVIDSQGRLLVPPVLRRQLGIENGRIQVRYYQGAVEIYSDAEAQRRLEEAMQTVPQRIHELRKRGVK